jgi:hypothetical protein
MDDPGRLVSPGFTDGFIRCEAAQCLQTTGEVVGGNEVGEMQTERPLSSFQIRSFASSGASML